MFFCCQNLTSFSRWISPFCEKFLSKSENFRSTMLSRRSTIIRQISWNFCQQFYTPYSLHFRCMSACYIRRFYKSSDFLREFGTKTELTWQMVEKACRVILCEHSHAPSIHVPTNKHTFNITPTTVFLLHPFTCITINSLYTNIFQGSNS